MLRLPPTRMPRPQHFRADTLHFLEQRGPQFEAFAAAGTERLRPFTNFVRIWWRRTATVTFVLLAALLFVHVMFGANGMVVFRQKRAEWKSLQKKIVQVDQENER